MFSIRPARRGHDPQEGAALVTAIFVSFLLGLLGLSYVMIGELEARTVQRHVDRERCRLAAEDVATLATSWWAAPEAGTPFLPGPAEWTGRFNDWRERGDAHPFAGGLPAAALRGDDTSPDLLLEDGPYLDRLGETLGEGLLVERVAISAPAGDEDGRPLARATLSVTVSAWRGGLFGGRSTLVSTIEDAPAFRGPELIAAGGDVRVVAGARLRWGQVRADGDVQLPGPEQAGYPRSGLPRNKTGFDAVDYAPGGDEDWNLETSLRESVLSELIGYTRAGERVPGGESEPPRLADPWLSIRAGDGLFLGGQGRRWAKTSGSRQPQPYAGSGGLLETDASHLLQRLGDGTDPLLGDRAEGVLRGRTGASGGEQRGQRRFVLSGVGAGGEGLWAENGVGDARPAADWLSGSAASPFVAVFTAAGRVPPPRVTVHEGAGIVVVEAERLLLVARSGGRLEVVNMPGEPFQDTGIDIDGDGRVEPSTAGNGRWDCDCDGDGRPDVQPPRELLFDLVHGEVRNGGFPDGDHDPAHLALAPHEPFLNLDYPVDGPDDSVRVVYGALPDAAPRPVRDLDGDGLVSLETDLFTTRARDEQGARMTLPLHFRGLVVNAAGSVQLGPGYRLHGAVRALGDVELQAGAGVSFDEGLALEGRPSGLNLPCVHVGAHDWGAGTVRLSAGTLDLPDERRPRGPLAELGGARRPGRSGG
jgi:hypothetical protein